jgi:hypothetical protein
MKGLDGEELEIMALISMGYAIDLRSTSGGVGRLLKRGLVTESTVSCGARDCVGHQSLDMTSVGVMVWNAVKCGGH